ncbi:MAG: oxidoreductase [Pseudomonadota bacterium]
MNVKGKVILVTGAARGIGAAIAQRLGGAEALVLTDIEEIHADLPCPVLSVTEDLESARAPQVIFDAALAEFGRVDGLVNAAGITTRASFEAADPDIFDRVFAINTRAAYLLMARAIEDMKARQAQGAIVNILTMNAHCGIPELAVYAASKGALTTLTKNAANAHMADRIRVNGINLGWVATETERALQEETLGKGAGWMAAEAARQPLGRFVSEDDAARLTAWLLSDASAPTTGVALDLEQKVVGA